MFGVDTSVFAPGVDVHLTWMSFVAGVVPLSTSWVSHLQVMDGSGLWSSLGHVEVGSIQLSPARSSALGYGVDPRGLALTLWVAHSRALGLSDHQNHLQPGEQGFSFGAGSGTPIPICISIGC